MQCLFGETALRGCIELSAFLWGRKHYCGIAVALMVNSDIEGFEWGLVAYRAASKA